VLDSLRQPLETGDIAVARANQRITFPARFQLIAAMNPCRCGWGGENGEACARGPKCAQGYQARVSGPMMDRIDLQIDVPPVTPADLALPPAPEGTAEAAARVAGARAVQAARGGLNARLGGDRLDTITAPDAPGAALLAKAAEAMGLTARAYHRILRVARTIADLDGADGVRRIHIAEALSARRARTTGQAVSRPGAFNPTPARSRADGAF
jgi:magnesium chelatase family protein